MCFLVEDHTEKVPFSSYHIKGTYYQHDLSLLILTLTVWLKKAFAGFSIVKLLFLPPSFPHCSVWKEVTMCSPHLSNGFCSTSSGAKYLRKLFGILLHGRFVYSPPSVYLFNNLFILIWTHRYFYTLGYKPILYLFCCLSCSNFGPWEQLLQLVPCVSLWHTSTNVVFLLLLFDYFLTFLNYKILHAHLVSFLLQS